MLVLWLLFPLLSWAQDWPLPLPEGAQQTSADLDGDGVMDEQWEGMEGGSGWKTFTTCIRHGASGHTACTQDVVTAYARFGGLRLARRPPDDAHAPNLAAALLSSQGACHPLDLHDPAQGAMNALLQPAPLEGRATPTLRWFPGPPADQQSVCLTPQQAADYPGAFTWNDSGDLPDPGWTIRYAAAWPQWGTPETLRRTPHPVASTGILEVYQHAHALAVYDPLRNQHAWIANFESDNQEGFKLDRWERIQSVSAPDPHTLQVQIAHHGGPDTLVLLTLTAPPAPPVSLQRGWSQVGLPDAVPLGDLQVWDLDPQGQRCLLEGTAIAHIYHNGAVLAFSEDGGQTWSAASASPEDMDGTFSALALAPDAPHHLTLLRHRQIAGAFPLLFHSQDGGRSWQPDEGFQELFWSLSPESVAYAEQLARGPEGRVAVQVLGGWALRDPLDPAWRFQSASPSWVGPLPVPPSAPQTTACAARFAEQYVVLQGRAEAEGLWLYARPAVSPR